METTNKHFDCRNFAPVDVVKGLCHAKKEMILGDDPACEQFDKLPKCKHCQQFLPAAKEHLGTCQATASKPMTYPELIAVTCEDFAWKTA